MSEIPITVLALLCPDCVNHKNCVEPLIANSAGDGITCLAYSPKPGIQMSPKHVLALPDREPCADCACRKGTVPNGTPHTMAALNAAVNRLEPFMCHGGGRNRVCGGWLKAAKAKADAMLAAREASHE